MVMICFAFIIVIIFVYLPYDLKKKVRIFSLETTVYRGVMTCDFSDLRYYSRGEEVELNSIILEIPGEQWVKKLKKRHILALYEKTPSNNQGCIHNKIGWVLAKASCSGNDQAETDEHLQAGPW